MNSKLANISFVCALLVVSIHIASDRPVGIVMEVWNALVGDGVSRVAVPMFFLLSGYFLARHFGESGWWTNAVRKRVHSLAIPYLLINVLFLLFSILLEGRTAPSGVVGWLDFFGVTSLLPFCGATWFLRALIFLVLVSPIVEVMLRNKHRAWFTLMIIFVLYVVISPFSHYGFKVNKFFWFNIPLCGLFYFMVGAYLRQWPMLLRNTMTMRVVVGFLLLLCVCMQCFLSLRVLGDKAYYLQIIVIPLAMLWIFLVVPDRLWVNWLISSSFALYLVHRFVIVLLRHIIHGMGYGPVWNSSLIWHLGVFVATVGFSLVLVGMMKFMCPRCSGFLFGGR